MVVINSGVLELIFAIMPACARYERHRIKERTQGNEDDSLECGLYVGGTPPSVWQIGADDEFVDAPGRDGGSPSHLDVRAGGASLRAMVASPLGEQGFTNRVGVDSVLRCNAARIAGE